MVSGKTLRIGEQNNSTGTQKSKLHALTTNSKKKNWNPWGELSKVCSQIVLECLYLERIGRPDILWSVNKLARSVTKWTTACDKRLARLISYIHHTCEFEQCCHLVNTAEQCRLGLFQDSDFCRRSRRLKTNIRWTLVHFRIAHVRANKLDVHETDFSLTLLYRSWNNFIPCGFAHGWNSSSWSSGFSFGSVSFFPSQLSNTKDQVRANLSRNATSNKHTQNQTKVSNPVRQFWSERCWSHPVEREISSMWCDFLHFWGKRSRD